MIRNRTSDKAVTLSIVKNRATPIAVEQVPVLIPDAVMDELKTGDASPYFRVESIEFPAEGDNPLGYKPATYSESFFRSFIDVMNARPIPGSKRGHEFASRPRSDFYTVGGKIVNGRDGKGTAHLLIYIPPDGDETSNAGFIRDNRAGIVEFSIQAAVEFSVNSDTQEVVILSTKGGERNDAVPQGAMAQTVNAEETADTVINADGDRLLAASVRKARALINAGKYDAKNRWQYSASVKNRMLGANGKDFDEFASWHFVEIANADEGTQARYQHPYGDGRIVLRSALQAIASRASQQGHAHVADAANRLLDLIGDKEIQNRRTLMETKADALEFLTVNNGIPLEEIAKAMGQENKLATQDQRDAVNVVNALREAGFKEPLKDMQAMKTQLASVETERVANRLTAEFGPEKDAKGNVNPLREYAGKMITTADDLDGQIENLKKDSIAMKLAADQADYSSATNRVGTVEKTDDGDADGPIISDY